MDAQPALLYHRNRPVEAALRRHRLTESDLHPAARENGMGTLDDVEAVILQADGTLAVIGSSAMGDGSSVRPFVRAPN